MSFISIKKAERVVEIKDIQFEHPLIFDYFSKLPEREREDAFKRALQIGVVALMEDRIATFLARTENELGTELEALKLIYQSNVIAKAKTTKIGDEAEQVVYQKVSEYLRGSGYDDDDLEMTGSRAGSISRNKTGDLVLRVEGKKEAAIVIEVKFDKGITLGEFEDTNSLARSSDTVLSQLFEASVNREAKLAVVVLDVNHFADSWKNKINGIRWVPGAGFVVVVDHSRDHYTNLLVVIDLMRSMVKKALLVENHSIFEQLLGRMCQDLSSIENVEKLLEQNGKNLIEIGKTIHKHRLLVGFTKKMISNFIESGEMSQQQLLDYYRGEQIRSDYKDIEKDVERLFPALIPQSCAD